VVLADGDPLFFGIGKRLIDAFGKGTVVIYPNVTTLQVAASKLKIPWHDIQTISLHGRKDIQPLLTALVKNNRVAIFTDPDFNPAKVADELIRRGVNTFSMHVFEDLGTETEKTRYFELKEAVKQTFSPLNFIILNRIKQAVIPLSSGLDDDLYLHQRGLITKREVRVTGLSSLEIEPHHTLWDLGAGCGSVAIEASLLAYEGIVLAVEKAPERIQLIRQNISRMGAYGVEVIHGEMPECLESLPDPHRIFIGGGMGKDNSVLEAATERLRPGGKLVLHLVLMGSLARARDYLKDLKWPFSITQLQVSRSKYLAGDHRLEALNPVFIISAKKPALRL
ncbi:MAG: precorrin-6y C5,15-methyltransferase (decarboxylating) subunit CbiE, partial [Proteobacteria bacterium]|nr:precorrin-6y C5,15-methyltransferase (decarboxylating) subunit CbiE [Pseudomonadota bacterium]